MRIYLYYMFYTFSRRINVAGTRIFPTIFRGDLFRSGRVRTGFNLAFNTDDSTWSFVGIGMHKKHVVR